MATSRSEALGAWPRWLNLLLGVWLFISAFVWPHTVASQTNTWILGVLIAAVALAAILYRPQIRYANTVLAVYLFISTLLFPHVSQATPWNNAIVAVVVFVLSLIPGGMTSRQPMLSRPATT